LHKEQEMETQLNRELHKILLKFAQRSNDDCVVWFNCSLTPQKDETWHCYVCQCDFHFVESFLEIDQHGFQHLKDSNLLPFI
jgi:hypothetical protein